MNLLAIFVAYSIFIPIGFSISKKFWQPNYRTFSIVLLAALIILSIVGARVVSIFDFVIYLQSCVEGIVIGILVRLLYRVYEQKLATKMIQ
jgi:hypothetical protein